MFVWFNSTPRLIKRTFESTFKDELDKTNFESNEFISFIDNDRSDLVFNHFKQLLKSIHMKHVTKATPKATNKFPLRPPEVFSTEELLLLATWSTLSCLRSGSSPFLLAAIELNPTSAPPPPTVLQANNNNNQKCYARISQSDAVFCSCMRGTANENTFIGMGREQINIKKIINF